MTRPSPVCSILITSSAFLLFLSGPGDAKPPFFIRGDTNADGGVDISDGVFTLNFLFQGGPAPACDDAVDANDDGTGDLSDAVYEFNYLFLGGPQMPPPFPGCGLDPTDNDPLDCAAFPLCEPPIDAQGQITLARQTPDGAADIAVPGAVVTYLRPAVGTAPAGFFVQATPTGPAIVVEVDPAATAPALAAGDTIDFRITELGTVFGARTVRAIADLAVVANGFPVTSFVQDVTAATDLVTALDSYESELVSADCTLVGSFASAGSGHVSSQIDTAGVIGDSNLRLRMPSTLRVALAKKHDLREGCMLEVTGPMWRFNAQAQPSVYFAEDLTVVECPEPPVDPSAAIALARATPDGPADILVRGAVVTYLRPLVGGAPAGFFVQAVQAGPAIVVEIDPDSLDPEPQVGDVLTFRITEVGTIFSARTVRAIAEYQVVESGFPVASLVQEVSLATDLVSNLSGYESELIHLDCSLVGAFASAASGHVSSVIETDGITGDTNLRIRMPTTLRDALAAENHFVEGCALDITGPMWRFNAQAQPSVYFESDIVVESCPPPPQPRVVSAEATSTTEVVVAFDIAIDPASVVDPGVQFAFLPALAVIEAEVAGTDVTLATAEHAPLTEYTVTVAATVTSPLGAGVDPAHNSATFTSLDTGLSIASVDYPVIAHGARLVITGNGFADADEVTIGGEPQAFAIGSSTQITVASAADSTPTGAQPLVVSTAGGGSTDPFAVTVVHLVLDEVDSDQTGTDVMEFVEVSAGVAGVNLAGYTVVLYNGNGDVSYGAFELNAATNADGLLLLGPSALVPAPQIVFPGADNQVQNGQDGVALVQGVPASFPAGTGVPASGLIDALVYDTNDADDSELLAAFFGAATPQAVQVDELANGAVTDSIQRCDPARLDGRRWAVLGPPTPGTANTVAPCP
jgi:hypothetical protein